MKANPRGKPGKGANSIRYEMAANAAEMDRMIMEFGDQQVFTAVKLSTLQNVVNYVACCRHCPCAFKRGRSYARTCQTNALVLWYPVR